MGTSTTRAPVTRTVTKTAAVQVTKTSGGFHARVSTFGIVDSQGDVVKAGAFKRILDERGGGPFPVVWAHQMWDPSMYIGKATAAESDDGLDVDADYFDTDTAQHVRRLMDEDLVVEFSWSGKATGHYAEAADGAYVWEIDEVTDLWEFGPVLRGANPDTELLSMKALSDRLATKEGRALAQQHVETLKSIHDQLGGVIDAVEKPPAHSYDKGKADDGAPPGAPAPDADDGDDTTKAEDTKSSAFVIPTRVLLELAAPTRIKGK